MLAILHALGMFVVDLFKSRSRLEAENLFLRHQLNIALQRVPPRLRLRGIDRALFTWMIKLWPSLLGAAQVVQPETILRWHRAGFKAYWRWKSRNRAGRPKIDRGLRDFSQRMSRENPRWGASRIHGELLMLGSKSPSQRSRNTWCDAGTRRRKPGRHFYEITLRRSPPSICALCRRSPLISCLHPWFWGMAGEAAVVRGDTASDGRVAGLTDHRGISLDIRAGLPSARQ
jgi:hypothetical protein